LDARRYFRSSNKGFPLDSPSTRAGWGKQKIPSARDSIPRLLEGHCFIVDHGRLLPIIMIPDGRIPCSSTWASSTLTSVPVAAHPGKVG